jgi:predicted TPR repeat methyltransferase
MNRKQRRLAAKQSKAKTLDPAAALSHAVELHQSGQLDKAEGIYQRILSVSPHQPEALNFLGILFYQRGRAEQALSLVNQALERDPQYVSAHNNRGNILKKLSRHEEALAAYRKALELDPGNTDALSNLGTLLKQQGHLADAIAAYRQAIVLNPEHANAHYNLGRALAHQGQYEEAITAYRRALQISPGLLEAQQSLGTALYQLGQPAEAIAALRRALELDPDNPNTRHLLAAYSGENIPARAADGYVQTLFDDFADHFDEHLRNLEYRAPALIAEQLAAALPAAESTLRVLDAGCGTGLCGPLLRPYAQRLVGVDLSSGMLAKARLLGIYDELVLAELTAFLKACSAGAFDLIVSADTLVYFGDLQPVLQASGSALSEHGRLVFTAERAEDTPTPVGYRLNTQGRYSHGERYLRNALTQAGLSVRTLRADTLRTESGQPVPGWLVMAVKETGTA